MSLNRITATITQSCDQQLDSFTQNLDLLLKMYEYFT